MSTASRQQLIAELLRRLAKGEIDDAEYSKLRKIIDRDLDTSNGSMTTNDVKAAVTAGLSVAGKASVNAYKSLFGSYEYQEPTDSSPLEITKEFSIYGSFFTYKGARYEISDIKSIDFASASSSINAVPMGTDSFLRIILQNGSGVSISASSFIIKGKTNKLLAIANHILSSRTFEDRYYRYVNELKRNKYLQFGKVRITSDGCLVEGNSKVDLEVAAKKGYLMLGTSWGTVIQGRTNPKEILAGETGVGMFSDRIRVQIDNDRDVIFTIVKQLAGVS